MSSVDEQKAPFIVNETKDTVGEEEPLIVSYDDDTGAGGKPSVARSSRPSAAMLMVCGFAALSGLLFGLDTSLIAGVLLVVDIEPPLSVTDKTVFVSVALPAAALGASIGGSLADWSGRRLSIGVSALLFIAGAVVLALSDTLAVLLVGRVIVGFAIGVSSSIVPMFVGELSPPKYRGALMGLQCIAITFGQFVAFLADYALGTRWRWMLALPIFPAAIQLFGVVFFVPESPLWLAGRGRMAQAEAVIRRMARLPSDVDAALEDLNNWLQVRQTVPKTLGDMLRGLWIVRRALLLGCTLQASQQLIGINTIMYYSAEILSNSGFGDKDNPGTAMLMSTAVAAANAAFTVVAVLLVDRVGRRKLMLFTLPGVMLSLVLMSVTYFAMRSDDPSFNSLPTSPMALSGMILYVSFFAAGMGVLPWLVTGEIFPPQFAGLGNGVTTAVNWLSNLVISLTFLYVFTSYAGAAFAGYAVITLISFIWFFVMLPETKGLTVSEIQARFRSGKKNGVE
jgi:sugar porter (SP) family MFS transporter